ncbi:hypothetical protein B1R32_1268 [Abditibacterium utsteinense]|uniref:Uncharacterized protein n=1 Tax=Abditibacterium utsteinense TaxID=1960156 RepID=A0A2S8SPB7_9BACT|nr:hypothetical protein [Abditibacterium utsteinense]PQV62624.1 hypothetical protein B1R32_1268 [Abditibacterium utsteinense]
MKMIPSPWLGASRGYLSDWVTQRWVQLTGRKVDLNCDTWLNGPTGKTTGIGKDFFEILAREEGLQMSINAPDSGLIEFALLSSSDFDATQIQPAVIDFYERTSRYDLDAWGQWCGAFRPFGALLALIFSRRLQQLNVPLSPLDTSLGLTSEIVELVDEESKVHLTAWLRQMVGSGDVLYAGSYSVCRVPGHAGLCVKVVFPLPNGSALVFMKPEKHPDGSLSLHSTGEKFGDPGFYFLVKNADASISARYVRAMRESIHVYAAGADVRANHTLKLWGLTFLRLHYKLREKQSAPH